MCVRLFAGQVIKQRALKAIRFGMNRFRIAILITNGRPPAQ